MAKYLFAGVFGWQDLFGGTELVAARPSIDLKVARLVRLLHTLELGFTRRQVAFGDCGQDKELETEGVFMNKRTKLAIAVSAAMWLIPISRAVAGIDVQAGDWKIDFAGNVNAFYVGTSCDTPSPTTAVAGGLACTGDHSTSVRNGLLPAALVFSGTTRQSDLDIDVTIGFCAGITRGVEWVPVRAPGNPHSS